MKRTRKASLVVCGILVAVNALVWSALYREGSDTLRVSFLDVGQGDAIFIRAPGGAQILVDGGSGGAVLRELSRVMPFYDRTIDVVIATHPDKDHIGGLSSVLARFQVSTIVEPGVLGDTATYAEFLKRAREEEREGAQRVLARRGQVVDIGGGARLVVLFPDRDVSGWDTNDASIILRVEMGSTAFILTGDSPKHIEHYLLGLSAAALDADVLKLGHHGSRTSSASEFVSAVSPSYAVISAGRGNTYGHPHKEVMDILARAGVPVIATYDRGTVTFESDGARVLAK